MAKNRKAHFSKCPVCSSGNTTELYPSDVDPEKISFTYEFSPESQKTFRVVRCSVCSHVFCSPLPKNMYKNYENVVDKEYIRQSQTRILSAKSVLDAIEGYAAKGRLLDVGCATGDFLAVARDRGYVAEGLELSRWSADLARKKGLVVYNSLLNELSKKFTKRYDIITMWGVIEHFENPHDELAHINKMLRPGGLLVIWTGNVDGLMSRILGRRWWYWQGQHIQYFTNKSLNNLASLTGFDPIATKRYPIAATYEQINNSLNRYKFQKFLMPLIKFLFFIKPIWYLRMPGEMLWLGRKRLEE